MLKMIIADCGRRHPAWAMMRTGFNTRSQPFLEQASSGTSSSPPHAFSEAKEQYLIASFMQVLSSISPIIVNKIENDVVTLGLNPVVQTEGV
jgi:hypothetical protein